jgi:uncharacterized protein YdiU (UPF0061 family)
MLEEGNAAQLDSVLEKLVETAKADNQKGATDLFKPWLKTYAERIKKDQAAWAEQAQGKNWEEARSAEMRKSNPRFVLRQWILEETIAKLERGEGLPRRKVLGDIMKVSLMTVSSRNLADRICMKDGDQPIRDVRRRIGRGRITTVREREGREASLRYGPQGYAWFPV